MESYVYLVYVLCLKHSDITEKLKIFIGQPLFCHHFGTLLFLHSHDCPVLTRRLSATKQGKVSKVSISLMMENSLFYFNAFYLSAYFS